MNPVLVLPLALIAGAAFGGWRYTKHPRLVAMGAYGLAFFAALGIPAVAGAIASLVVGSVTGIAVLLFADVYCSYVLGHEVWTGEHHEPVRTPLFCAIGGLSLAATFVAWPEIKAQIAPAHLFPAVWHAILAAAATARQVAITHSLPPAQSHRVLFEVLAVLALVFYGMRRHNRQRMRVAADPAVTMVDRARGAVKDARDALGDAKGRHERKFAKRQLGDAKQQLKDVQLQARQAAVRRRTVKPLPTGLTWTGWRAAGRKARGLGGKRGAGATFQPASAAMPPRGQGRKAFSQYATARPGKELPAAPHPGEPRDYSGGPG